MWLLDICWLRKTPLFSGRAPPSWPPPAAKKKQAVGAACPGVPGVAVAINCWTAATIGNIHTLGLHTIHTPVTHTQILQTVCIISIHTHDVLLWLITSPIECSMWKSCWRHPNEGYHSNVDLGSPQLMDARSHRSWWMLAAIDLLISGASSAHCLGTLVFCLILPTMISCRWPLFQYIRHPYLAMVSTDALWLSSTVIG